MPDKRVFAYKIGVLLVNFNQWELTYNCVKTLLASVAVKVTIALVDNNSSSPPPDWVLTNPAIKFCRNKSNMGLTAGNNQAFNLLDNTTDFVFILNNDTEVAADTLLLLANYLSENPNAGITAPAIPYAEQPSVIWSAGGNFSLNKMVLKQIYKTVDDLPDEPVEMEQVTGCAIMMRTEDYSKAGMQDSDLFVYYEDTDLCFKVRKLGKKIVLIPGARVLHYVSISVGGVFSQFAVYFTHRNRLIIARRHLKQANLLLFCFYYMTVTFAKTLLYPLKKRSDLVPFMWLAVLHGVLNKPEKRPKTLFSRNKNIK